jgi:hypothetical protein
MFAPSKPRRRIVHVRVVRFTDVTPERMEAMTTRINEGGGPPPEVPASRLQALFDEAQGTAVVLQYFETAEDLDAGAKVLGAMDSSETPGQRASVDACEQKLEVTP